MNFTTRLIVIATALAAPAFAGDVDDVMATPSRAKTDVPSSEERDAVKDYLSDVHGEVTALIGSGGTYGVSGTAVLPLGENGSATVTLSTSRGPGWLSPYSLAPRPYGEEAISPYEYYRQPLR